MIEVPQISTPRFTLRSLRESDCAALFPTLSDPEQCRYLTRPAFADEAELWGWLADPEWNGRTWIAVDDKGDVAARLVAVPAHEAGVEEIGYITAASRQRQGVASECVAALLQHLFNADGCRKLVADADCENEASIRLLKGLGFEQEALFREHELMHIGLRDVCVFGLLKREWLGAGS